MKKNMIFDFFLFIFSLYLSLWLRFNGAIPLDYLHIFYKTCLIIALIKVLIFYLFKNYKVIIKHFGTHDVIRILKSNVVSTILLIISIIFLRKESFLYPRSVIIIDFLISFVLITTLRYIEKYLQQEHTSHYKRDYLNTLIIGAGEAGNMVLREIRNNPSTNMKVIGFIDDDKSKEGLLLGGKKIFGGREKISDVIKDYNIKVVIVAIPSARKKDINEIIDICEKNAIKIKIVPSTIDIIKGDVKLNQIRDIKIEDLLDRDEIKLDLKLINKLIKNKKVLITGAGGSIGSEISRQVAKYKPAKLLLLGKGENSIFNINMELKDLYPALKIEPVIGDIRDYKKMETIFKKYKPDIVFHAAAHKHVYLMELHPDEAFKNNVLGTLNLVKLAVKYKVKRFIMISTDKAVNPTSVMGMTKRIAEKIVVGYNFLPSNKSTRLVAVRFGNVLGSRGSVVPIFKKQIENGGPVTVTDPEVKRYFMTIPEAVQLVLQAAGIGKGGEIFILDMGKPVKILDLAKKMIRLSGYMPGKDIKIKFIGLKPGEKMFEELVLNKEKADVTRYEKIFIDKTEKIRLSKLLKDIEELKNKVEKLPPTQIKKYLKELI